MFPKLVWQKQSLEVRRSGTGSGVIWLSAYCCSAPVQVVECEWAAFKQRACTGMAAEKAVCTATLHGEGAEVALRISEPCDMGSPMMRVAIQAWDGFQCELLVDPRCGGQCGSRLAC